MPPAFNPATQPGRAAAQARLAAHRAMAGLLVREERWSLSWRGRLVLAGLALAIVAVVIKGVYPFLATTSPVPARVLVVEGWLPDYALLAAVKEYYTGHYSRLLTSGAISKDGWLDDPKYTTADWAARRLKELGFTNQVVAVPCRIERADRTYHCALMVRRWLEANGAKDVPINVATLGPHARRTRLLFGMALSRARVGVIALESRDYAPEAWWRSSEGVREVIGETIAYVYARVFFHPSKVLDPLARSSTVGL